MPEADEVDDEEEMPLSLRLSIADTLTLGNATCGFMAVYFTTTGILIPHLCRGDEYPTGPVHSSVSHLALPLLCRALRTSRQSRRCDPNRETPVPSCPAHTVEPAARPPRESPGPGRGLATLSG
ncbi:hypothetical protein SVIOM342S_04198 [Streptomyces violaceorubidus]